MTRTKKSKPGRGAASRRGGRGGASAQGKKSATPAGNGTAPTQKLKLKLRNKSGGQQVQQQLSFDFRHNDRPQTEEGDVDEEANEELPVAKTTGIRTTSGRVVKKPKLDDYAYSSDIDKQIALQTVGKADRQSSEDEYQGGSSPPAPILVQRNEPTPSLQRRPGRLRKTREPSPTLTGIEGNGSTDSPDIPPGFEKSKEGFAMARRENEDVLETMNLLCGKAKVYIDLPKLVSARAGKATKRYTAKLLMKLYIEANKRHQWNLCDLIADTWIRAFHAVRRRAEKSGKEEDMLWRLNKPLMAMRMKGKKGYDTKAPSYSSVLHVEDPDIDPDVTDFNTELLDDLYKNTPEGCGARTLWADAMALCGKKLEHKMRDMKRRDQKWHPDLIFEVMCTSLRLSGRKLTLKIEESTEGAWCKRYHEHYRRGQSCYRELAQARRMNGLDISSDEDEDDTMAQAVETELGGQDRRGPGAEARAGDGDVVMVYDDFNDGDAEGETDDE